MSMHRNLMMWCLTIAGLTGCINEEQCTAGREERDGRCVVPPDSGPDTGALGDGGERDSAPGGDAGVNEDGGPCAEPFTHCGGACVDTAVDAMHCGGCDAPCDSFSFCRAGGCVSRVVEVSVARGHACARRHSGEVLCWGDNSWGQLGDGTTTDRLVPTPALVTNAVTISAGSRHSCAVTSEGATVCWGNNFTGQLGDGSGVDRLMPVTALPMGRTVSAGHDYTCAANARDEVFCWGLNDSGQLGDATTTERDAPVMVMGVFPALDVAGGDGHTCIARRDGSAACWGGNGHGELGTGDTTSSTTPRGVVGISGVTQIETGESPTGYAPTCALVTSGDVYCWGSNAHGKLGRGTSDGDPHPTPEPVMRLTNAREIAVGGDHACARVADGAVWCWGWGVYGALGAGDFMTSAFPVRVVGVEGAVSISADWNHTCAVLDTGDVMCWGENMNGELGDGTTMMTGTPVPVASLP